MTETLRDWQIDPIACTRFCEQADLTHVGGTKDPDIAAIIALAPDLVILDREENRREDYEALVAAGVPVRVLRVRSLRDVDHQIGALAHELGRVWTHHQPPLATLSLRAFIPIWRRPWMALGGQTYGESLLGALGVTNVYSADGSYPEVSLEDAARRRPNVVLAPTEPYPFNERHRSELELVGPTLFVDGRDLLWWGSRTADALRRLEEQLRVFSNQ